MLPVCKRDLFGRGAEDGTGVVDENIDAAELLFDLGEEVFGARGRGEIGAKGRSVSTNARRRFGCGTAVAMAGNRGSRLRERNGDSGAETAG
jgi:hypothetical protein